MKRFLFMGLFFSLLMISVSALAAPQASAPVKDTPQATPDFNTPISILSEGSDSIGAKLATRLKERFNQSSLFRLTSAEDKDTPELRILISTQPEFADRPSIGSVYGICWLSSQKGYLSFLLGREIGTVDAENLEPLVDRLIERTDGIAAKYSNLWK